MKNFGWKMGGKTIIGGEKCFNLENWCKKFCGKCEKIAITKEIFSLKITVKIQNSR